MGRPFVSSYLAGEPAAQAFFAPAFREREARIARTRAAAQRGLPAELLAVLAEQQALLPASSARRRSLEVLAAGRAAVVVTGQQVGLFLGPLYTYYKAASAVAVAAALAAESGVPCVPVFWLQTEDHDFTEIRSAAVWGPDGAPLRLDLEEQGESDRVSVAHRTLPAQVVELLDVLGQSLGGTPAGEAVVGLLRQCYRPGLGLAAAFAATLASLFADEGLLLFDPRDPRVAALAAPIYRDSIEHAARIEASLHQRATALEAAGMAVQVPVREQSSLVFFHRNAPTGPRFRLVRAAPASGPCDWGAGAPSDPDDQAIWQLSGGGASIAQGELLTTLAREPLRFSSSALLRPIVQDWLFPTAGWVVGPGEISYAAQLGPLYAEAGLAPPLLVPRARFCMIDARSRRRLAQLGLTLNSLGAPAQVRAALQGQPESGDPSLAELRGLLASVEPTLARIAALARPGLGMERSVRRTCTTVRRALDRLLTRYGQAIFEQDAILKRRLGELEAFLAPAGVAQERFYAWPALAGRVGPTTLKELVMRELTRDPFATELHEVAI